jgi:hypothetical protein
VGAIGQSRAHFIQRFDQLKTPVTLQNVHFELVLQGLLQLTLQVLFRDSVFADILAVHNPCTTVKWSRTALL